MPTFMPRTTRNRARRAAAKRKNALRYRKRTKNYRGLPKTFAKNMRTYNTINCEKKIMPMNNYLNGATSAGYLQDIPAVGLPNAGLDANALSCVVLQTGRKLTTENATLPSGMVKLLDGYSNPSNGTLPSQLIGQYAKITSSYLNLNITMDPIVTQSDSDAIPDFVAPHQFRLIMVKAKRNNMVNAALQVSDTGVPSIATNLFRNESGASRGINSDMATQDAFTWFVNKQFWTVLKDERFTLAVPYATYNSSSPVTIASGVHQYKSSRFRKYWLPKPKNKVIFRANTVDGVAKNEVIDYNYVTHVVLLCKNSSAGERPSNHFSVQANGATQFIDE